MYWVGVYSLVVSNNKNFSDSSPRWTIRCYIMIMFTKEY